MNPTTLSPLSSAHGNGAATDPQAAISATITENPALQSRDKIVQESFAKRGDKYVNASDFADHVDRYGFYMLNPEALEALKAVTAPVGHRVVSVCTGLGYSEAQMVAAGMSVIGFDKNVPANRWLLDTHDSSQGLPLAHFSDRALLISFPDPTKRAHEDEPSFPVQVIQDFVNAGGSLVIVITEARPTQHAIRCDQELVELLAKDGRCIAEVALPKWPTVSTFLGYGHTYHTFEPVLKAYRLGAE